VTASTLWFFDDQFHYSKTAPSVLSVSSTEAGSHKDNVRSTDWSSYWKPSDGATDGFLTVDGSAASWLGGTSSDLFYCFVAYDARGSGQSLIKLQQDSLDASGFTNTVTNKLTFTVATDGPTIAAGVALTNSVKRYYRLAQLNADRTGTKTAKIYNVAFYRVASDMIDVDNTYPSAAIGASQLAMTDNSAEMETAAGIRVSNAVGGPMQSAVVPLMPAPSTLWVALRDFLYTMQAQSRAFYLQFEGLKNFDATYPALQMVTLDRQMTSGRRVASQFETQIPVRTVNWY
jgi:hypothetical protein